MKVKTPENLYSTVILRIDSEKRKSAKRRLFYTSGAILISVVAFVEASASMLGSLARSGFYNYFSLIFSDGFALVSSWKEFVFSLVESFSVSEFIVLLSIVFVVLISVKILIKNYKIIYTPLKFA